MCQDFANNIFARTTVFTKNDTRVKQIQFSMFKLSFVLCDHEGAQTKKAMIYVLFVESVDNEDS
jgi:hypothetical protein